MNASELEIMFTYHHAEGEQPGYLGAIRKCAQDFAQFINDVCPESMEKAEALKRLNEAMFWANAAIARHQKKDEDVS